MDLHSRDRLIELRRDLHQHPEPAWCEFYTTDRLIDAIQSIGIEDVIYGRDVVANDARMAVPEEATLEEWADRAIENGADPDRVATMRGGYTGVIAVLKRGEGPTIGLRVDIDALRRSEATDDSHIPAAEGFRSTHPELMHACGHDAHAAIGIGVLEAIADSDFEGTVKVIFQPAEEQIGGGKAIADSGHLDDIEYLFAMHLGLEHPTGKIIAGIDDFLAVRHFDASFTGTGAHAGGRPNEGENAVQAMATAVQNLYGIPRHDEGATRVNAGIVSGGTASNIIPESANVVGEVRGGTTELKDYMWSKATRVLEHAAGMHGCSVNITSSGEAPSATSDQALIDIVMSVSDSIEPIESRIERDSIGGSEDATYLMKTVQDNGGLACYVGVGTDHPGGHHTATFDVDEESIPIAVTILSETIQAIGNDPPELEREADAQPSSTTSQRET